MGPIELVFLAVFILFGIIGIIRGYARELGVTTMLLLVLFVLEFIDERYRAMFDRVIGIFAAGDARSLETTRGLIYCALIVVITYVSYEGETLSFHGKRGNLFFDLGSGLLNGYLFAGSLWYYLDLAKWPVIHPTGKFTPFYETVVKFLPPKVFEWQYLVGLAVLMLIARIWK